MNEKSGFDGVSMVKATVTQQDEKVIDYGHIRQPILFLDFDLVLNDQAFIDEVEEYRRSRIHDLSYADYYALALDSVRVKRLNKVLDGTSVQVVFSTSWRWMFSWEQLQEILTLKKGFRGTAIGETPKRGKNREEEILSWLGLYCKKPYPAFCALDDRLDFFPTRLGGKLVLTTDGLEEEHLVQVKELLSV